MNVDVRRVPAVGIAVGSLTALALALWGAHHVIGIIDTADGHGTQFGVVFAVAYALLAVQTVLAYLERPVTVSRREQAHLDTLDVVVAVPAYNEDPGLLRRCLMSLLVQRRLPNLVFVVDDGSSKADYRAVRAEFEAAAYAAGVPTRWVRTLNSGKRAAQGVVFADTPTADLYVTVDSDSFLDREAIHEVIKPFKDPGVYAVGGVVLASNAARNLLTRLTDLWFVSGQLVDRSAASTTGSVLVNSGPLAAYRADLVRDNLDGYLHETFFGRPVEFSDDSMLTIYALTRGRAVQQPTAFALTAMPETLDHHLRQYVRWMRGATIRSWWRFKYLPIGGVAFWMHLLGWIQMLMSTVLFVLLFVAAPVEAGRVTPLLLLVPVAVGVAQSMRYLLVRRSDQGWASTLGTLALAPVAVLWAFFALRLVRWYAMATCLRTGWGTREDVELRADETATVTGGRAA